MFTPSSARCTPGSGKFRLKPGSILDPDSPESRHLERQQLLSRLQRSIAQDESVAQGLLASFDLPALDQSSRIETSQVTSLQFLPSTPPKSEQALKTVQEPDASDVVSSTFIPTSESQNPFLSTPLRKKHFPRLSPSILRDLLRSPSIREASTDDEASFDSILNASLSSDNSIGCILDAYSRARSNSIPVDESKDEYLPSPPLTARLPSQPAFNSDQSTNDRSTKDDFRPDQLANNSAGSRILSAFLSHSSLDQSAIEDFHKVIAEFKGTEIRSHTDETTSRSTEDDLRDQRGEESTDSQLTPLEQEFAALLSEKAEREEQDARTLLSFAHRLQKLAKRRKGLVTRIAENKLRP